MNEHPKISPTLAELVKMPVHPMAERFPLWPQDRLGELAEDIKANGLNIPLVVWTREPMLLDGRNRLAACKLAGIEPRVEFYDGDDPRALIISRNIQTREMSASQKAMLLALEYPETDNKGGRGKKNSSQTKEFSPALLSQARQIIRYAGDRAEGVLSGAIKFSAALKVADENRVSASATDARLTRLDTEAPDLARQVREETLSLEEAEAALAARKKAIAEHIAFAEQAVNAIRRTPAHAAAIIRGLELGAALNLTREELAEIRSTLEHLEQRL